MNSSICSVLHCRRGQAGLEFMMTYGWVFFIILALVVLTFQSGLFGLGSEIPAGNLGFWGIMPYDTAYYGGLEGNEYMLDWGGGGLQRVPFSDMRVALKNDLETPVNITSIGITMGEYHWEHALHIGGADKCRQMTVEPGEIRTYAIGGVTDHEFICNTTYNPYACGPSYFPLLRTGHSYEVELTVGYSDLTAPGSNFYSSGRIWGTVEPGYLNYWNTTPC